LGRAVLTVFSQGLRDVGAELHADVGESGFNTGGEFTHASGSGESDHSNEQSILDKILPAYLTYQSLQSADKSSKSWMHDLSLATG
jgi:hypothetical protein